MDRHIYLRAYMAGVVVPTILLLLGFFAFLVLRFVCHVPTPIERILIFPLAIIPNAFGVWNMLYVALRSRWRVPIGLHGAALPCRPSSRASFGGRGHCHPPCRSSWRRSGVRASRAATY